MPTFYDEENDMEVTYRDDYPYVQREQSMYRSDKLCVVVLGDIADVMRERKLPGWENARTTYNEAAALDLDDDAVDAEWLYDASYYPPTGVSVDWDGDAGTVTTTLVDGWPKVGDDDYPSVPTARTFTLTLEMSNVAFDDPAELPRVLHAHAGLIDNNPDWLSCTIRDINGNAIGSWEITTN